MTTSDTHPQKDSASFFERPPGYHSYLLRFWEERSEELPLTVWRFSLEDPATEQRYGFANLDALVSWITAKIAPAPTEEVSG